MKKAFTMVELIIVIVIIGILASVAVMSIPDTTLRSDTSYIIQKIKEKQLFALNYDHFDFNDQTWRDNFYNNTCINTDKTHLNNSELKSNSTTKYIIRSNVTAKNICFDNLGRPYKDNYKLNNFLKLPIVLNIGYKNETKKIVIMPYSGNAIQKR
jgi:prepilin-type N-terminal cleavage/methylation domain-containing protein